MGEAIKKKASLKEGTDEFTKKYDNLFDEIFSKSKVKSVQKEEKAKKDVVNSDLPSVTVPPQKNIAA